MTQTTIYHVYLKGAYSSQVFITTNYDEAIRVRKLYDGRIDQYTYDDAPYVPRYIVEKGGETGEWQVGVVTVTDRDREKSKPGEHSTKYRHYYIVDGGTPEEAKAIAQEKDVYPYYGVRIQMVSLDEVGNIGEVLDTYYESTLNLKWKTKDVAETKLQKLKRIVQRSFARPNPDYVKPEIE